MIYTAVDNFYVDEEHLEDSPSRRDGVPRDVETQLQIYGCQLIQEGGILLGVPQAVMATGQVLLHRFYVKESLKKFNIKRVAWACFWLATKLEEAPAKRPREVLLTFYRLDLRHEGKEPVPLDVYGKEYATFKKELIDVERCLLRTFGFVLHVDHPHKFVLNYCNLLKVDTVFKQEAWNLANDSLRTNLCVRYWGETVACGLIFLAARRLQVSLPEDPPWWDLFKVSKESMYAVAREVQALFSMPKVEYISVHKLLQGAKETESAMFSPVTEITGTPLLSDHAASDLDISHMEGEQPARPGPSSATSTDKSPTAIEMEVDRAAGEEDREPESRHERHRDRRGGEEEEDRRRRKYRRRDPDDAESDREERSDKREDRREREHASEHRRERREREDRGRERGRDGKDQSREKRREKDAYRERDRDRRRT